MIVIERARELRDSGRRTGQQQYRGSNKAGKAPAKLAAANQLIREYPINLIPIRVNTNTRRRIAR